MLADSALSVPLGHAAPRIAPPLPARSDIAEFRATATSIGVDLLPWQDIGGRYLEARGSDGRHLYREVAIIVARQNGKTELLVPLIVKRLLAGERIMHTAQDRRLPQEVFNRVAEIMWEKHPGLFPTRNGRPTKPRYANGQEEVRLSNGAIYTLVAPTRGGARGPSRDLVIVDELREMDTWDFIAAAKPTLTASPDPQMLYLSNAGTEISIVLNALRDRAGSDPRLAYLEWSAAPDRAAGDIEGWRESNPSMGHVRAGMGSVYDTMVDEHRTALLEGTLAIFETEHLCRWVVTMRERLVDEKAWAQGEREDLPTGRRIYMGVALDPSGERASAALAWQIPDGMALQLIYDVTDVEVARLGADLRDEARRRGVRGIGHDPLTDGELAKFFVTSEKITSTRWSNATATFVNLVESGRLHWKDCAAVGEDLKWTARKENEERGSFQAVRSNDNRPVTAALAAIRAVEMASGPRPLPPRIY